MKSFITRVIECSLNDYKIKSIKYIILRKNKQKLIKAYKNKELLLLLFLISSSSNCFLNTEQLYMLSFFKGSFMNSSINSVF